VSEDTCQKERLGLVIDKDEQELMHEERDLKLLSMRRTWWQKK
jgi:hypothetical protein